MNPIKHLSEKLNENKINDYFSSFYYKVNDFKIKFFAPFVLSFNSLWSIYCFKEFNIQPNGLHEWLLITFFMCALQPAVIILFLSYITPINGTFFRSILTAFPSFKSLKSIIEINDYHDEVILKLYHDKDFIIYIVNFYKFLNNINFAESYYHNEINYKNKSLKENYDKLNVILNNDDEFAFIKFFKQSFLNDFHSFSNHPKVNDLVSIMKENYSSQFPNKSEKQADDDLLNAMQESLKEKEFFKKYL